jgi:hypothetical protein
MIGHKTARFDVPNEMRAVAERSVQQAKLALDNYLHATQEAVSMIEEGLTANQVGAQDISKKAMTFAERNVTSSPRESSRPKTSRTSYGF